VLWGRREESGVEEERTRERKNAACLVELETHWCAALSLSPPVEIWEEKQKKVKSENLRGVRERFSGFNLEFW
jgi:hypothetical protein